MGDRVVPRAEDRLASHRRLALAAVLPLLLAACGDRRTTEIGFRNDLARPVQVGLCRTSDCRSVHWWVGIDPKAVATEPLARDGSTARFLVVGPPDTVYGCLAFRLDGRAVTVPLSRAHGCGSGR